MLVVGCRFPGGKSQDGPSYLIRTRAGRDIEQADFRQNYAPRRLINAEMNPRPSMQSTVDPGTGTAVPS